MRLIALTLALWLTLATEAFAESDAYNAGYIVGRLFFIALIVGALVLLVRKLSRR